MESGDEKMTNFEKLLRASMPAGFGTAEVRLSYEDDEWVASLWALKPDIGTKIKTMPPQSDVIAALASLEIWLSERKTR